MPAARKPISAGFGRLPGRTSSGTPAGLRKGSIQSARRDMQNILNRYAAFLRRFKDVTPDVLENAMRPVFEKALYYTPVDTGDLYRSGELKVNQIGPRAEAEILFGDSKAWYAALVHEYVWLNHDPPTRAKYLQSALEEEIDSFMTSIALDYSMLFR